MTMAFAFAFACFDGCLLDCLFARLQSVCWPSLLWGCWLLRWLLLRLSNKGRTNVSSAWMAVLKHPAIGAKSRFTKIYENLRKSCDVTKMRFGRKIFVSQKDLSDTHMTSSLFSRYSFSSWRYSWCGVFRILDFGNLISFERNGLYQILPEIQCGSTTNASVNPTFSSENTR